MFGFAPLLIRQLNRSIRTRLRPGNSASRLPFARASLAGSADAAPLEAEPLHPTLVRAIRAAAAHLEGLQAGAGFWEGKVYDNVTITAEYIMFLRFLGILDAETRDKAKAVVLSMQLPDGGWNIYGGGPADNSATVEAYFTLKLCGMSSRHPALRLARELILARGGIQSTRVFTKIHLALFGAYPWNKIPVINPELMLLPKQAPIHLYEFSSWSRSVIVPLLIIFDRKPVVPLKPSEQVDELHAHTRRRRALTEWDLERIFAVGQKVLSLYEMSPLKPLRKRALQMAEDWIWEHQDPQGNWGGYSPRWRTR